MVNFKAGAAKVNITPPVGTFLSGYAGRKGPSIGIHDDLYSKALVFKHGNEAYSIITNDLIGLDKKTGHEIRELIRKNIGIPPSNIIITCSHTHSGPQTYLFRTCMGLIDHAYMEVLKKKIAGCVYMAFANAKKAYIGIARGKASINVNRRKKTSKGRIALQLNPRGPVDEEVGVLKVVDHRMNPIAHLINYTCHAVVLGSRNLYVSADYPGVSQRVIEQNLGGIALFTNGSCGDVNTRTHGKDFPDVERLGKALAGEVIKISMSIANFIQPNIRIGETELLLPWKIRLSEKQLKKIIEEEMANLAACGNRKAMSGKKRISEGRLNWAQGILEKKKKGLIEKGAKVRIQALFLGSAAFVAIPGEVFVEIGKHIKRLSPFDFTYILGYADGVVGYIPTKKAIREGGYETRDSYIWYNTPAFLPETEDVLINGIKGLLR